MIFLAVGTQNFPFDSLLRAVDALAGAGSLAEEVFAQTGYCQYRPAHFPFQDFLSKDAFEEQIRRCSLLLTHGGVSTIVTALREAKPVVVVPRRKQYGEHVDDHQVQIAESFAQSNLVLACLRTEDLGAAIREAKTHRFDRYVSSRGNAVARVRAYLASLSAKGDAR